MRASTVKSSVRRNFLYLPTTTTTTTPTTPHGNSNPYSFCVFLDCDQQEARDSLTKRERGESCSSSVCLWSRRGAIAHLFLSGTDFKEERGIHTPTGQQRKDRKCIGSFILFFLCVRVHREPWRKKVKECDQGDHWISFIRTHQHNSFSTLIYPWKYEYNSTRITKPRRNQVMAKSEQTARSEPTLATFNTHAYTRYSTNPIGDPFAPDLLLSG
ncbi:hypothetical protein K457DRAFT_244475 [Linnemannia elongata AG-77]|uniref:Uncharacterized protein n=1 Tax=Linnemannia elongata AG-77 TaxID=1314771 RepID=A0A197JFD4_9FUNG|nr:hypothetical protein K457DRAFT_244475 [Linnemannia elongata AG-77]